MPVNFQALQGIAPPQVVANLPASGGGGDDGGIGELFSGLSGLVGGIQGAIGGSTAPASTPISNPSTYGATSAALPGLQQGQPNSITAPRNVIEQSLGNEAVYKNALPNMNLKEGSPILTQYLQKANPGLDPTKTPWCAGFVGSVLNASGLKGTGSLAARSYLKFGDPVKTPGVGDIVVLNTMNDPNRGHVGFYAGNNTDGTIKVLGGNQDNSVSIKSYPSNIVLGYRAPPKAEQVQGFAQKNNIQSPNQLAAITTPDNMQKMFSSQSQKAAMANPNLPNSIQNNGVSNMTQNLKDNNNPFSIDSVYKSANTVYSDNPILGQVATAQAILESNLLKKPSGLAQNNNLFGIKGKGTAGSVNMPTHEYVNGKNIKVNAGFAKNATLEDSFTQHRDLMNKPRYEAVRNAKTFDEAVDALQKAGYATDPNYAKMLKDIYKTQVAPLQQQAPTTNPGMMQTSANSYHPSMGPPIPPINPFAEPPMEPTTQQSMDHDARVYELDQGRDSYSQSKSGVLWDLLNNIFNRNTKA